MDACKTIKRLLYISLLCCVSTAYSNDGTLYDLQRAERLLSYSVSAWRSHWTSSNVERLKMARMYVFESVQIYRNSRVYDQKLRTAEQLVWDSLTKYRWAWSSTDLTRLREAHDLLKNAFSKIPAPLCQKPVGPSGWTWEETSALDAYVKRHDIHYRYDVIGQKKYPGYMLYSINMTSQKWKSANFSDHPVWWHFMSIVVPDTIVFRNATFMYIGEGDNVETEGPPDPEGDPSLRVTKKILQVIRLAIVTKSVGVYLRHIPNQPIVYKFNPSRGRSEDDAIALMWRLFLEDPSDPEVLLRLPMTKAVVRAMDTVTDFCTKTIGMGNFDKFVLSGASKRAWTTWTTAAVDTRVIGIIPKVLSSINMNKNAKQQFRSLGGWTWSFVDYFKETISQHHDRPPMQKMVDIIDPYSYIPRLTLPKLIISASMDEFFMIDDSHYFFKDLRGPKYFRLVENSGHSLTFMPSFNETWDSMQSFYLSVITKFELPRIRWEREETSSNGSITLYCDREAATVVTYVADTTDDKRRDFRRIVGGQPLRPSGIVWKERPVKHLGNYTYRATVEKPQSGWRAFIIKVTFTGPGDLDLTFSTEVQIIPDTFPSPGCYAEGCYGSLV